MRGYKTSYSYQGYRSHYTLLVNDNRLEQLIRNHINLISSVSVSITLNCSISDNLSLINVPDKLTIHNLGPNSACSIVHQVTNYNYFLKLADNLLSLDQLSSTIKVATRFVSSNVPLIDTWSYSGTFLRSINDVLTLISTATATNQFNRSISQSLSLLSSVDYHDIDVELLTETLTLTDLADYILITTYSLDYSRSTNSQYLWLLYW